MHLQEFFSKANINEFLDIKKSSFKKTDEIQAKASNVKSRATAAYGLFKKGPVRRQGLATTYISIDSKYPSLPNRSSLIKLTFLFIVSKIILTFSIDGIIPFRFNIH